MVRKSAAGKGVKVTRKRKQDLQDLVKTEIDAAEALAEFSQQAHLPFRLKSASEEGDCTKELRWLRKRKRTSGECSSSNLQQLVVSNVMVVKQEDLTDSDKDDNVARVAYNRFDTSEDSLGPGCRGESPSSPLPPLGTETSSAYAKIEDGLVQFSAFNPSMELDSKSCLQTNEHSEGRKLNKSKSGPTKHLSRCVKMEDCQLATSPNTNTFKSRSPEGKPKHVMSETEKEARRQRRIEANRESARQTIRRKQILCDELTKKAHELQANNERMKHEKELLRQECRNLHENNSLLRHQISGKPDQQQHQQLSSISTSATAAATTMQCGFPYPPPFPPWAASADNTSSSNNNSNNNNNNIAAAYAFHMWMSSMGAAAAAAAQQIPHFFRADQKDGASENTSAADSAANVNSAVITSTTATSETIAAAPTTTASASTAFQHQQQQQQQQQPISRALPHKVRSGNIPNRNPNPNPNQNQNQNQNLYKQQQQQQQHYGYYGRGDPNAVAAAAAAAAQARRRRKELTRSKNLTASRQVISSTN